MGPGLSRAVPLALIGFLLGALFVIALRAAQSMDPIWDAQIGLLMAGFFSTVFFVWGMGAFDPKMSEHHAEEPPDDADEVALALAEAARHAEEEEAALEREPARLLTGQIWEIAFWTAILFGAILAFAALPGGFALQVSGDPAANRNAIGMIPVNLPFSDQPITINGEVVLFSEFVVFVMFAVFTLLSLAAIGGIVGLGFYALSRGVATVKAVGNVPLYSAPALAGGPARAALPSGQADAPAPAARLRKVSDRARAVSAPILLNYAVILGNLFALFLTLNIFGVNIDQGGVTLALIVSFLLAQLIANSIFPPAGRPGALVVTGLNVLVFAAAAVVFAVIVNFVTGTANATWLYVPLDPTRAYLPLINAAFITPLVTDMVLAGLEMYGGPARALRTLVVTMLVFNVLYIVFYGPAIGLVVAADPARTFLSAINAPLITLVLLRTTEVTWCIGRAAGWLAGLLGRVPENVLGQR